MEAVNHPYTLLDARIKEDKEDELHCLVSSIVEKKNAEQVLNVPRAFTELHWIVLKKSNILGWQFIRN